MRRRCRTLIKNGELLIPFGESFSLTWLRMKVSLQLNKIIDQVLKHLLFLGTVLGIIRYSNKQEKHSSCFHGAYIILPYGLVY